MNRATPLLSQLTASAQARLDDPKNAAKGDWSEYTPRYCLWLYLCEIWELEKELLWMRFHLFMGNDYQYNKHRDLAIKEAGDVTVTKVMRLNVLGVIKDETAHNNIKR